jgi:hypothetical protein
MTMATRLLERVPLDRIEQQSQPVDVGRLVMLAVVGVFYLLGFVAAKAVIGLGVLLGWVVAAVRTGWQDARLPAEERSRARAA